MNDIKNQATEFAKSQATGLFNLFLSSLKKTFTFMGRATRKEFWTCLIACTLINIICSMVMLFLSAFLPTFITIPLGVICLLLCIFLMIPVISVAVRRLHDLNLTGFWLWYLSPFGLPIVFMVGLLNLDTSCSNVMERIRNCCNNWVAWLLLPTFWGVGAPATLMLLFLYSGKNEANKFGESPYA